MNCAHATLCEYWDSHEMAYPGGKRWPTHLWRYVPSPLLRLTLGDPNAELTVSQATLHSFYVPQTAKRDFGTDGKSSHTCAPLPLWRKPETKGVSVDQYTSACRTLRHRRAKQRIFFYLEEGVLERLISESSVRPAVRALCTRVPAPSATQARSSKYRW